MAEPLREQVVQALLTTLEAIAGVRSFGTAYPNEPQFRQGYGQSEQISHRPSCRVLEVSGSTFQLEVLAASQTGFRHRLELQLLGFVKADADVAAATWLRRFWSDIISTLHANFTLGGLISAMELGPLETDEGLLDPQAEFVQPLTLVFFETVATD